MTRKENVALMLAFSKQKLAAVPVIILAEQTSDSNLEQFFPHLVLAMDDVSLALRCVVAKKECQWLSSSKLGELRHGNISVPWFFSSGLFVGVDNTLPPHDSRHLISDVAIILTSIQLANLTPEMKNITPVLELVLTPIFRTIDILPYPKTTLCVTFELLIVSIITYIEEKETIGIPRSCQTTPSTLRAMHVHGN